LPPAPTASAPMSPATLFRAAQAARSRGDRHRAIQLYRQLQARHPDSREAAISKVSLAALMAEDEPGNALSEYDAYLDDDPKGALAEEALAGRARSLSRLGRDREARAAWRQLLRDHPGSFHAAEARRALAAKP
ncbi:MAG: tetratricopeptide repeat protein, partial [Myxococcota bacterium]